MTSRSLLRRDLLTCLGGLSFATILAGCQAVEGTAKTRLELVEVLNEREEPQTVYLLIENRGDPVYQSSFELDPLKRRDNGVITAGSIVLEGEWPSTPGQFTINARLNEDPSWYSLDLTNIDGDCTTVRARIEKNKEAPKPITFTYSRKWCEQGDG